MHKRSFAVVAMALAGILLLAAPAFAAHARQRPHTATADTYVNPFTDPAWGPSRTDMGVDWVPNKPLPVLAVGNAVVLGVDRHAPWPGGKFIYYQLLDGSHAGDIIYVAEHLSQMINAGTHVRAGHKIAQALPGYPYIETGWADQYGSPIAYPCYKEGSQTRSGKRMARFLQSLGATVYDNPGPGLDSQSGPLC
ncbi:MAG: hypothetical protein QOG59_3357 [Solirubrobacteraceae bacterium]|jgi:hypothetical protein|nr:hypothetical protein [Solirubrobacteraceae bacterium]